MKTDIRTKAWPVSMTISFSRLSAWMSCRERAHLHYQRGLRKKRDSAEARDIGSMFHEGLEFHYNTMRDEENRQVSEDEIVDFYRRLSKELEDKYLNNIGGADQVEGYMKAIEIARPMLIGYVGRWHGVDSSRTWEINEGSFSVPAPGKWGKMGLLIEGFWDGVFRNKHGRLWIFETKTKSRAIQTDRLVLDMQLATYHYAARHQLGETCDGALYNVVMRPGLLRKKGRGKNPVAETENEFSRRIVEDIQDRPGHYFQRSEVPITPQEIDESISNLEKVIDEFMEWQMGRLPTYKNSHSCENPFRCSFLELCSGGSERSYSTPEERKR